MSAVRASCSAPASARPSSAVDACVPLMSASPSFGASVAADSPARASAAAPGSRPDSCHASPSPTRTSARCASGARSPLAPTEPRDGTTGWTPLVQQRDQQFERLDADAGEPLRQHVGAQRHHRAHDGHRQRFADAGRVTAQQVQLQLRQRVGGNRDLGEVAEPGVDAVGRRRRAARTRRPRPARRDARPRRIGQRTPARSRGRWRRARQASASCRREKSQPRRAQDHTVMLARRIRTLIANRQLNRGQVAVR